MRDKIIIGLSIVACGLCVSLSRVVASPGKSPVNITSEASKEQGTLLLAKDTTKAKKGADGRRKILTGEASYKNTRRGQKTNIDFDEASIDGARKTPTGVAISKNRPDQEFDLINLRLSWHPEMKESTTRLETGKGK